MKKHPSNQTSMTLLYDVSFTLDKPMFYHYEKHKFGTLSRLCINNGDHKATIDNIGERNKITCEDGNSFITALHRKGDNYIFDGNIQAIDIPQDIRRKDIAIQGKGTDGSSLRPAQIGAIYSLLSHWSLSNEPATIVLPTGTGKTETMLALCLADDAKKILVIVPSIDLKYQTSRKFSDWGILRDLGVISHKTLNPCVMVLERTLSEISAISVMEKAEIVITTPALIARANQDIKNWITTAFSHVFFDEAHHMQAKEWSLLKSLLNKAKIVQFTATPYRYDRKPIEGKIVYNYPLSQALKDNCFSKISLISVDERHPLKKDRAIAFAAYEKLQADRANGFDKHKMMVRADKLGYATSLYGQYKEWFPKERIALIHSQTRGRKFLIESIKKGDYDIIICVDMLKEGFDYPEFKIAAVHRLHQSLGVLLQFIGRFARVKTGLGDASFIVNYADDNLSTELENLLQEGDGWEHVISEIADAKKTQAESLLAFLQGCKPYSGFDSPNIELNPKTVYPALSSMFFKTNKIEWNNFKNAFNLNKFSLTQPYINEAENVFYFSTQKREKVKWAKTDKIKDQTWNLIVMYWDKTSKLLYIHNSDKSVDTLELAKKISISDPIHLNGDCVFRSFHEIKRLSIVHAGIFKPANHLHRYSRLSGADVTTELSKWKSGINVKKSDFVGIGFRDGEPESVGASVKGKVWSPARIGDLTEWKKWCLKIGAMITDESIDSNQLLKDSAKKIQLTKYPKDLTILSTDFNEELYSKIHKLVVTRKGANPVMLSECTIRNIGINPKKADFCLTIYDKEINFSITLGGENGHIVEGIDGFDIFVEGLKSEKITLKKLFEENPPTMFLINGSTISGSIHTDYNMLESASLTIPQDRINVLQWTNVIFATESMYKNGKARKNSIQEYVMQEMVSQGARIVFNDDNSGESADVIAIFEEADCIRFELIHCKYSKSKLGATKGDLFEVCGQAIISLRYKWKPEELLKHMERRDGMGVLKGQRYYHGDGRDTTYIKKAIKYSNVKFGFSIAQPGIKASKITPEITSFLGSIYTTIIEMTETKLKCYFS
ncbi:MULTISPECIES: DEAD/DEAH box helicase [unclassified Sphingobacterium]|uniref:DEAD/DEAH box helicase n=1 Tax=unclassified Sphingobacterium TaxID=2609468 RepID=UPI0025F83B80|nr:MULTISPECIES: DEAD/DEAH box helicase family protein [unclassified Sphingobacterium]